MEKKNVAYLLGIAVQSLGWAAVFFGLLAAWIAQIKVTPFRYLGF